MSEDKRKSGRPRLSNPNEGVAVSNAVLSDTAFGLTRLADGKNVVVKIKYNPLTGGVGTPEIEVVSGTMTQAEDQFREMIEEYIELEYIQKAE